MQPQSILVPVIVSCLLGAWLPSAHGQGNARQLVAVTAPGHDPLFVDANTVQHRGSMVSFKYLLDVRAAADESGAPGAWKSNEIEASIDCSKHTVVVRRLVAYSGPKGSGTATGVHSFTSPSVKPERISPQSTFAYLEKHLCRGG